MYELSESIPWPKYKFNKTTGQFKFDRKTGQPKVDPIGVKGLTRADLEAMEKSTYENGVACSVRPNQSSDYLAQPQLWARLQFNLVNKPEDSTISLADVERSLAAPPTDQIARRSLQFFRDHYQEIADDVKRPANKGLTLPDLQLYALHYASRCTPLLAVNQVFASNRAVQQEGISPALYADSNQPEGSITYRAVKQLVNGECYTASPLAATANAHPALIRSEITDNGNGTFTVVFPHSKSAFTVDKSSEAEISLFNPDSAFGQWPSVMLKAYGLYEGNRSTTNDRSSLTKSKSEETSLGIHQQPTEVPQVYVVKHGGGDSSQPMELFTGHGQQKIYFKQSVNGNVLKSEVIAPDTEESLRSALTSAFPRQSKQKNQEGPALTHEDSGKKVVLAVRSYVTMLTDKMVSLGANHCYSILDFDADGANGGTLTILNPRAGQDGTFQGKFTMSLADLIKHFDFVEIENDQ